VRGHGLARSRGYFFLSENKLRCLRVIKETFGRAIVTAFSAQKTRLLLIVLLAIGSGCSLNSFSSTIIKDTVTSDDGLSVKSDSRALESCPAVNTRATGQADKAFVLIHGIYGGGDTFGELPTLLACDYPGASVYVMRYWSSQLLPNFQRLIDLGRAFHSKLEEISTREKGKEIVIIAHSQGRLIAREAILRLKGSDNNEEQGQKDPAHEAILKNLKLIMIGTPNYGSL
jgi:triacylglycerol esterase/lipase EstA (alpha/beta hydrolase family)